MRLNEKQIRERAQCAHPSPAHEKAEVSDDGSASPSLLEIAEENSTLQRHRLRMSLCVCVCVVEAHARAPLCERRG